MKICAIYDQRFHNTKKALKELYDNYGVIDMDINNPELMNEIPHFHYILALGGDGLMLKVIHKLMSNNIQKPVYGINFGSVGFLMNTYNLKDFETLLIHSILIRMHPLEMTVTDIDGTSFRALAINEVSFIRQTSQSAKIQILINDKVRLDELVADGVLLSTAAGSTAYNLAANGPIVPLNTEILLLTPISPFRPRRWRGALLPRESSVKFINKNPETRPVSAVADFHEVKNAVSVVIKENRNISIDLLFDNKNSLYEKILIEQFI